MLQMSLSFVQCYALSTLEKSQGRAENRTELFTFQFCLWAWRNFDGCRRLGFGTK